MSEKKEILKYRLKIDIESHSIGTKPILVNILGHVIEAILCELRGITEQQLYESIQIVIGPKNKCNVHFGSTELEMKEWVQAMFASTVRGFIETLKDLPQIQLSEVEIHIEFQKKTL